MWYNIEPSGTGRSAAGLLFRRGRILIVVGASVLAAAGCATKKDLAQVRLEMQQIQARQDAGTAQIESQVRDVRQALVALMDSLHFQTEALFRVRGDLAHQLLQMEQQLVNIQELTGQSQRRIADLRQDLEQRGQRLTEPPPAGVAGVGAVDAEDEVAEMYRLAMRQIEQNAPRTARLPLQQILESHLTHPLAPDAQFQLAETFVLEREFEPALREFERVVERFPNSPRAPQALFRAGIIQEERRNIDAARGYFNRILQVYPQSEEVPAAREALLRLPGRS